ncbi:type II secretion system F family protein [Streptomyces flavochromogenes]|uniref:Type II secretion system F family protein n=1 Tax=Streptomyces flavochromogenes TaxID=68199 RepID=A0ABW6XNS5_9ACTN|nr:type II secretion system F family protein [Streptomyces flavochromogenes]
MRGAVQATAVAAVAIVWCEQGVRELVCGRRARGMRRRLRDLLPAPSPAARARRVRSGMPRWVGHWAAPLGASGLGWVLFGVFGGLAAAVLVGAVVRRGAARGATVPAAPVEELDDAALHLPLAADLLAACASAGAGPGEAAEAVGRSLGGPLGERLARTAAELRLGGEPAEVWRRFGAIPGATGLARCMERAGSSGAPAAEAVARHAAALRSARARTAAARARRAQVLISGPVGLCFLPAFLAVGVAPVVIGLATGLLDG